MANKKDKFTDNTGGDEEFDFDQFDDLLDDDDDPSYTGTEDRPNDKRKPAGGFSPTSVLKNAASVQTVSNIASKVGDEFYHVGKAYSSVIDTASELNRYKQDVLKDIAPTINSLKRAGKIYAPKVKGMLPAKLYDKLTVSLKIMMSLSDTAKNKLEKLLSVHNSLRSLELNRV